MTTFHNRRRLSQAVDADALPDAAQATCRQCTGDCGRCGVLEQLAADEHPLGLFVGLRNAFLLTAAAFGAAALLSWVWP
jgi:hypothetical protein